MLFELSVLSINALLSIPTFILSIGFRLMVVFDKSCQTKYFDRLSGLLTAINAFVLVYLILNICWVANILDHEAVGFMVDLSCRVVQSACAFVSFFLISFIKPFDLVNSYERRRPKVARRRWLGLPRWQWEVALYFSAVVGLADSLIFIDTYNLAFSLGIPVRVLFSIAMLCISLFAIITTVGFFIRRGRRLPIKAWTIVLAMLVGLNLIGMLHVVIELCRAVQAFSDDVLGETLASIVDYAVAFLLEMQVGVYMLFACLVVVLHAGFTVHHHMATSKTTTPTQDHHMYIYRGIFAG
ncbi:hypothetical protein J8273_5733 [Carpediemonas membranifera]|uniref:Uncharacterized protein n=1 Tax=Carpediemonas membranifera TaxID=201153 RepID=A0A8J6E1D5_9EUKA|nr:hypothetical protein J8273_5733 [Carpediemonas membranifera]|eukprot:KAG9392921.1 hypothetical protein J8273_5733 [Carpediemonas membranifera]